ncbi:patatin-like phospholipase family protein [Leifsonia shinshuensis]|uniref:Patatin-like phospholipase family protein n=1 Tax=Leifsonia shinshuensis TaxID=150026 RepID=A0A7G6YFR1_9MICO|nr:patatin-like phospholipase family protein [Leifsonia shinshuensis]QNE37326.1 patatin-like phospholipase family protein [Leifsonia shinshuensis]
MNADTSSPSRALVLHGGGSSGNAWELGVIAGLLDGGLDVTRADLIVGTSAGSTAAAQITSAPPGELYAAILDAPPPQRPAGAAPGASRPDGVARGVAGSVSSQLEVTGRIIAESADAADMRRRMGAWAIGLANDAGPERQAQWRGTVASRLPSQEWPEQNVVITAVDARTGEGATFDRHSGVALADAVAASCSSGFAYALGDERYIDGGYRRNENADLAAGYDRVLVLSPFGGRTRHPLEWGMQLSAQVDELRAGGSEVETIVPDAASLDAFGESMMDLSRRPASAQAGYGQGRAAAGRLSGFWAADAR